MKRTLRLSFLALLLALLFTSSVFAQSNYVFSESYDPKAVGTKNQFAKELAILVNEVTENPEKCYIDVEADNEYAPYICGLKSAKVFRGSTRSYFRGENTTKWSDALRGLCRSQDWIPVKTYRKCKAFAETQGFLDSPLPSLIRDKRKIIFEDLELLFERTLKFDPNNAVAVPESTVIISPDSSNITLSSADIPPRGLVSMPSFNPLAESDIEIDFFENIVLDSPLPNRFYQNEVYVVSGKLSGVSEDEVLLFLCEDTNDCSDSQNFLVDVTSGNFRVPLHLRKPGNIQIGIIPGRKGSSRVATLSILPQLPAISGGSPATNLDVEYKSGDSVFTWGGNANVTQLVFFQDKTRKDFVFRQRTNSFTADPVDFVDFKPGIGHWFVINGTLRSEIQTIDMSQYYYREIDTSALTVLKLTDIYSGITNFNFKGEAKKTISGRAAITGPDGFVTDIQFSQNDITPGEIFTISYDLRGKGAYIFEINDTSGKAVLNIPIYVNAGVPIIPEFFDLNDPILIPGSLSSNINTARSSLLNLINDARRTHKLNTVISDIELNGTAQSHSEDMNNRNFFAHVNPDGLSPDDRRKTAGIPTPIRENLARSSSLLFAHEGLMRSPIHRDALLDPTMKRVGIGVVQDNEGYIYVTEHFSTNEISTFDLLTMTNELLSDTATYRGSNGLPPLNKDVTIGTLANNWSIRMAGEDFFGLTANDGTKLLDLIRDRGILTSIQVHALQASSLEQLSEQIIQQEALNNSANNKIGIGLAVDSIGQIFLTVIYTP